MRSSNNVKTQRPDQVVLPNDAGGQAVYSLPKNVDEVIALVKTARANNEIICLRGAAHSIPLINTLEKGVSGRKYRYVMLSNMNKITSFDTKKGIITAEAGIHLGLDPSDPTGISTLENSLLYQMDKKGWAFSDLGGITHQTLGGFISTGSSGGSTAFSFHDSILSLDMICCTANGVEKVTFKRPNPDNPDDPFYGALISLGVFGIIVSVTLQAVPSFNIVGQESITTVKDCEIDIFGRGTKTRKSFRKFLETTTYSRCVLWPQANVQKMVVWCATPVKPKKGFKPKPYQEVPWIANSPLPASLGADMLFTAMGRWPDWLSDVMPADSPEYAQVKGMVESQFYDAILPMITETLVPVNPPSGPQKFQDHSWSGLPMDNQMNDKVMPVWFTELWIPISKTQVVMKALKKFYAQGPKQTGAFCCEIYAAKKSNCWLSPSYGSDVVRFDVFWFGNNKENPGDAFYPQYWKALAPFGFRPHWGKFLPDPKGAQGVRYLKKQYPKWNNWMKLRKQLDPHGLFLNDYWRAHLGVTD